MNKEFKLHNLIDRIDRIKGYRLDNLHVEDEMLVVTDKAKPGYVYSPVFSSRKFTKLVASWCALTPNESIIELSISVTHEGKESKFFSYGRWTLGGENLYYNQTDDFAYMSVDEVYMNDGLLGDGFSYKVELNNDAKLSLVCVSLKIPNYSYDVDCSYLPSVVDYDVPKLNQNMVPVIGFEMCSATTSAMLLKFKGMDFRDKDAEFEHRYVANLVADRGHNSPTFGNWVYNTAVISAFGFKSYLARFYSWNELKRHLAKVGPVGASIAGDTGIYKTGGHLLVVRGYKEVDGKTFVICNDPNINSRFKEGLFVYYEFPLETFERFWRGVVYIVE